MVTNLLGRTMIFLAQSCEELSHALYRVRPTGFQLLGSIVFEVCQSLDHETSP